MPVTRARHPFSLGSLFVASLSFAALSACAPKTGLLFEVQGPAGQSTIAAGIAELRLVTAHASYCGRWVTGTQPSSFTVDVHARDLGANPISILLSPDARTDLSDPVRAIVLALDASGQLLGQASFSPEKFVYEQVSKYAQRITLLGVGMRSDGPRYVADDGCVCIPGQPYIGNSSGTGCDARIPPSLQNLISTAGCELPPGASLPIGICDGQLYPGERANRDVPCFSTRSNSCRIGQRVCNDQNGRGLDRECSPQDPSLSLPSGVLCDAFLACERVACGDPIACLEASALAHKQLHCTLPLSPDPKNGAAQACDGGSWSTTVGTTTASASCVSAMLDGTQVGAVTLGWKKDGSDVPQLVSASCPPTLIVGSVEVSDPSAAVGSSTFTISIGDQLYDVTLDVTVGCPGNGNGVARNFRCDVP